MSSTEIKTLNGIPLQDIVARIHLETVDDRLEELEKGGGSSYDDTELRNEISNLKLVDSSLSVQIGEKVSDVIVDGASVVGENNVANITIPTVPSIIVDSEEGYESLSDVTFITKGTLDWYISNLGNAEDGKY